MKVVFLKREILINPVGLFLKYLKIIQTKFDLNDFKTKGLYYTWTTIWAMQIPFYGKTKLVVL